MADQAHEDDLKLSKLIAAINKADNVAQEIKDKLVDVTIGNEVLGLDVDKMFSLYRFRYSFLTAKGKSNQSWADLLKKLEHVDRSVSLTIVILRKGEEALIVFADKDYDECFGMIAKA